MHPLNRKLARGAELVEARGLTGLCKTAANQLVSKYHTQKALPERPVTQPVHLQVETSKVCNLRCSMCEYSIKKGKGKDNLMPLADFETILDKFPYVNNIDMTGIGEPFLNPDFMDMVRAARKRKIRVEFVSHALLLNEPLMHELIDLGVSVISFSIDAATKKTYEELRSGANWERMRENIKKFCSLVKERHSLMVTMVNFTVSMRNINEMADFVRTADELGVDHALFRDLILFDGSDFDDTDSVANLDRSYRDKIRDEVLAAAKNARARVSLPMSLLSPDGPRKKLCKRPWTTCYVDIKGNAYPCCRVTQRNEDTSKWSFGNLLKEDFDSIWNNSKYRTLRHGIAHPTDIPDLCNTCSLLVK